MVIVLNMIKGFDYRRQWIVSAKYKTTVDETCLDQLIIPGLNISAVTEQRLLPIPTPESIKYHFSTNETGIYKASVYIVI